MEMLDIEVFEGGFKETELGLLPEEWEVVRLGEVAKFKIGRTPPRNVKEYWEDGKYFWVSIADMRNAYIYNTNEKVSEKAYKEIFKGNIVPAGTLLMSFKLTIGRTAFLMVDGFHNEAIVSIYPKEQVFKEFLFFYLPTIDYSEFQDRAIKGNTLNISKIEKIPLPIPPLEEQKAIAGILSTVQSAIEKTEKVINALKNLKKSMMKHLFTYGPVAEEEAEKAELKETEIGLIPKHWEVVRLGEVFDVKQGKQLSSKESKEGKTLRPFLRTSNVLWNKIDISSISSMPFSDEEFETLKLRRGDILVCEGGDVGRTSVWEGQLEECAYQNHLHRLRPKENNIVNYFFSYWMEYAICLRGLYVNSANRTTIPNLSAQRLKSFLIPLPPLEEQQKIAQILQSIDQRIEKEEKYKNALQNLFKSLLHNLMTGKIRVRVKSHGED
jgi:type I restriction enzyme S subunit